MLWLIGIALFLLFWFIFPPFRKFAVIAGILIVAGIGIILLWSSQQEQASMSLIKPYQIEIDNLRLGQQYSSYSLSGQIKNNSDHELTDIVLDVKAFDCPTSSITSACNTIGEDKNAYFFVDVPAGQVRSMSDSFVSFGDMPPVQGQFLWSYSIVEIKGG